MQGFGGGTGFMSGALPMAQAKAACRIVRNVGHIGQKHEGPGRRGASQTLAKSGLPDLLPL